MKAVRTLLLIAVLAGCAPDLSTVPVPPRPVPQTSAEIIFARTTLTALQGPSFQENREFCGLIGIDALGNRVATPPVLGAKASCLPPADAPGLTLIASYHTHGGYTPEFETEIPSYQDLRTDIEDGIDGYVSTPGGRFWFVDARAREVRLICGPACLATDPRFVEDPALPVKPRYTLQELDALF